MSLADDFLNGVTGKTFDYAGIFLPNGYLWANGAAVSRTTYSRLFSVLTAFVNGNTTTGSNAISSISYDLTTLDHSVIGWPISGPGIQAGTTITGVTSNSLTISSNATSTGTSSILLAPFGVGDGSTTFNLPDARGRVVAGRDDMGKSAANRMTAAGGVPGTQLGKAAGIETQTLDATQIPAHAHAILSGGAATGAGSFTNFFQGPGPSSGSSTANSTGGGLAHPNVQPTIVMHKIIKT